MIKVGDQPLICMTEQELKKFGEGCASSALETCQQLTEETRSLVVIQSEAIAEIKGQGAIRNAKLEGLQLWAKGHDERHAIIEKRISDTSDDVNKGKGALILTINLGKMVAIMSGFIAAAAVVWKFIKDTIINGG